MSETHTKTLEQTSQGERSQTFGDIALLEVGGDHMLPASTADIAPGHGANTDTVAQKVGQDYVRQQLVKRFIDEQADRPKPSDVSRAAGQSGTYGNTRSKAFGPRRQGLNVR